MATGRGERPAGAGGRAGELESGFYTLIIESHTDERMRALHFASPTPTHARCYSYKRLIYLLVELHADNGRL